MTDKDKKPNYLIWIMIGVGILVLVLGIGFYLMWRKMSSGDIKAATTGKTVEDLRVAVAKLEQEVKGKDEKMQELVREVGELKTKNTELSYQVKDLKKNSKPQQTTFQMRPQQTRIQSQGKKQQCDDNSCTQDVVEDIE